MEKDAATGGYPGLGEVIRRAREAKHLKQRELADLLDVTAKTVGNWERGATVPRSSLGAIEEALGLRVTGEPDETWSVLWTDVPAPRDLDQAVAIYGDAQTAEGALESARRDLAFAAERVERTRGYVHSAQREHEATVAEYTFLAARVASIAGQLPHLIDNVTELRPTPPVDTSDRPSDQAAARRRGSKKTDGKSKT